MKLLERDSGVSWQKEFFSIPNILSYLRILMLPIFVWVFFHHTPGKPNWNALLVILLSGLTDCADGVIARKCNMITEWGKIIDPFADKLTQLTVACCLAIKFPHMFILFAVMFCKELVTFITTLVKLKDGLRIDSAMWFGKLATLVFYVLMVVVLGFGELLPPPVTQVCVLVTAALMLFAFVRYMIVLLKLKK